VSWVNALESVYQPTALKLIQRRQDRCEVGVVFRPIVLRLEQEDDLGNHERDPVLVGLDDLGVGTTDRSFATTDPHVAVVRISEDVEVIDARRSIADPGLVHHIEGFLMFQWPDMARADDIEVELRKRAPNLGEPKGRDGDLGVLVDAGHHAEVEVDRPACRDAPRGIDLA
jgi:hypothetical protein